MPNELDFPKRLIVVALSAAFPVHSSFAQQAVARIDFAAGNVTASTPGGGSRPVARGSEIRVGETVNTQEGRAQMRFADGAFVSLQPQTEFKVENYVFEGRTSPNESAVMSLIKGGMRTITGLIGKTNRDGYKLQTSTATVGIRGTEFTVSYNADGSITAFVTGGAIAVANQSGTTVVPGGRSVSVSSPTSAPQTTDEKPFLPPSGTTPTQIAIQTNVVQEAAPLLAVQNLLTGDVHGAGIASFDPNNLSPFAVGPYRQTYTYYEGSTTYNYDYRSLASLNAAGALTSYSYSVTEGYSGSTSVDTNSTVWNSGTAEVIPGGRAETIALTGGGTATVTTSLASGVPKGNDGIVAWGEWTNGIANRTTTYGSNGVATSVYNDSIDLRGTVPALYVVGAPVPVMPMSGSAQYQMIGAITSCAPNCSASVLGSKLEVDFRSLSGTQTTLMQINGAQDVFHGPLAFYPANYNNSYSSSQSTGSALFRTNAASSISGTGRTFVGEGFFAGKDASRAGMAFGVRDDNYYYESTSVSQSSFPYGNSSDYPIIGVIAYAVATATGADFVSTTTLSPGPFGVFVAQPEMAGVFNNSFSTVFLNNRSNSNTRVQINAQGGLFSYENGYNNMVSPVANTPGATVIAKGNNDGTGGNDGIVAWGRWMNATTTDGTNLASQGPFHYIVGLPATNLPSSGTFDFTTIGHAYSCISLCTTADVQSTLRVNYGSLGSGGANNLNVTMTLNGSQTYNGSTSFNFNGTRFNASMTLEGSSNSIIFNGQGFLAGNQSLNATARAGMAYFGYGSGGSINGVIAYGNRTSVVSP